MKLPDSLFTPKKNPADAQLPNSKAATQPSGTPTVPAVNTPAQPEEIPTPPPSVKLRDLTPAEREWIIRYGDPEWRDHVLELMASGAYDKVKETGTQPSVALGPGEEPSLFQGEVIAGTSDDPKVLHNGDDALPEPTEESAKIAGIKPVIAGDTKDNPQALNVGNEALPNISNNPAPNEKPSQNKLAPSVDAGERDNTDTKQWSDKSLPPIGNDLGSKETGHQGEFKQVLYGTRKQPGQEITKPTPTEQLKEDTKREGIEPVIVGIDKDHARSIPADSTLGSSGSLDAVKTAGYQPSVTLGEGETSQQDVWRPVTVRDSNNQAKSVYSPDQPPASPDSVKLAGGDAPQVLGPNEYVKDTSLEPFATTIAKDGNTEFTQTKMELPTDVEIKKAVQGLPTVISPEVKRPSRREASGGDTVIANTIPVDPTGGLTALEKAPRSTVGDKILPNVLVEKMMLGMATNPDPNWSLFSWEGKGEAVLNFAQDISQAIPVVGMVQQTVRGLTDLGAAITGVDVMNPRLSLAMPNNTRAAGHKPVTTQGREEEKEFQPSILDTMAGLSGIAGALGTAANAISSVSNVVANPIGALSALNDKRLAGTPQRPAEGQFWYSPLEFWFLAEDRSGLSYAIDSGLSDFSGPILPTVDLTINHRVFIYETAAYNVDEDGVLVLAAAQGIGMSSRTSTGSWVEFDILTEEEDELSFEVTSHPIYTNNTVSDHILQRNPRGRFKGLISNASNRGNNPDMSPIEVFDYLKILASKRTAVSIQTHYGNYTNVAITRVARKNDSENRHAVYAEVEFEQLNVVDIQSIVARLQLSMSRKDIARRTMVSTSNQELLQTGQLGTQSTQSVRLTGG